MGVGSFREVLSDQAVEVFDAAFFFGVVGLTKVSAGSKRVTDEPVACELKSVVVSDRIHAHAL